MADAPLGRVSIVIPAHNEGENLVDTVGVLIGNTRYPDFDIVVVDDASTDGSGARVISVFENSDQVRVIRAEGMGPARARNLGADATDGDVIVFLDGHSYTPVGWLTTVIDPLQAADIGIVGPGFASLWHGGRATGFGMRWRDESLKWDWLPRQSDHPYAIPFQPAGCQAIRRAVFEQIGGFDDGIIHWGHEEDELCLRVWLMGYQVLVQPQVTVYHLFRDSFPYHVDPVHVLHNRLRMVLLHFSEERIKRILRYHQTMGGFAEAMLLLLQSDVWQRRQSLLSLRKRDDDWFFEKFGLTFLTHP